MKISKPPAYYVSSIVVFLIVLSTTVSEVFKAGPFNGSGAFLHWSAVCALILSTLGLVIAAWELLAQRTSSKAG